MNRPTASIGTNTTSTHEEDEWDIAVSGETGVCVEALPQDVRDSLRVKQAAPVPVEPEVAVSGETGVCVEAISASVRDILQTPKTAAPAAATMQQNEPGPMAIEAVAVQAPEIPAASTAPTSLEVATHTPTVQSNPEPIVKNHDTSGRTTYENTKKERYSDLREIIALLKKQ